MGLLRKERDELLNQQNILNGQKLRMEEQYIKLQESVSLNIYIYIYIYYKEKIEFKSKIVLVI